MKVLIVLALTFAVSQAAFSGSLLQQTQPILKQALNQIAKDLSRSSTTRNSAEAGFQTSLINSLNTQATALLTQIENAVNAGTAVAQNVVDQFQSTIQQLQALGSNIYQGGQDILSSFISNIIGAFTGNSGSQRLDLSPVATQVIQQIATNPQFVELVHQSEFYQCLINSGIELTYAHLHDLNVAGQLNLELALSHKDAVIACVRASGGAQALITQSPVVKYVQELLHELGLIPLIHNALNTHLGPQLAAQVIALLNQQKGFFGDAWNAISNGASQIWDGVSNTAVDAWNAVSGGAADFAQYVANLATGIYTSAAEKFEFIKQLAAAFIQGGIATATHMTQQAAQEFLNFLAPYHNDLGLLYDQVVEQITGIWDGITLPTWGADKGGIKPPRWN